MKRALIVAILVGQWLLAGPVAAGEPDPYLERKAADYEAFLRQWHSTGLGGVCDVLFTDGSRTEMLRTWGAGDSEDWTAFYLVTQAMRFKMTGDPVARAEVLRIAHYLHIIHDVTGDPGYLARYVAPDLPPWNVEYEGSDNKYAGTGEYEGMFWVAHQVRDKYITWFWGLTWAYDTVDDEAMRETIREDFIRVADTLRGNDWTIVDPWGNVHEAAQILPDLRLAILLQVAHVTGDPARWDLLDREFEKVKRGLPLSSFAGFNIYMDYYAFINNHPIAQALFRLWPDRERLEYLFDVWKGSVRRFVAGTHAAYFDAVYYAACLRIGGCDPAELEAIREDITRGLTVMNEAPNWQRHVDCPVLPLDPFSVWADAFLREHPALQDLINIDPQTAVPHQVEDRCWESHLWERSPYHVTCDLPDDPAHTAPGLDYLIAYTTGEYYGLLPGDGPYGDDDPEETAVTDDPWSADDDPPDAGDDAPPPPESDHDHRSDDGGCG
jgi:hypothetical protein